MDLHARLSVDQLVAYSFEAFEAWARESGYGPYEFATIVGQVATLLAQDAFDYQDYYCNRPSRQSRTVRVSRRRTRSGMRLGTKVGC